MIDTEHRNLSSAADSSAEPRLDVLRTLLRHYRTVAAIAALCVIAAAAIKLLEPRTYTATAAFSPQSRRAAAPLGLSGVAAQFGMAVSGPDAGANPQFYVYLLRSPRLLRELVAREYSYESNGVSTTSTLVEFLDVKGRSPAARQERALRKLSENISATANVRTSVVSLAVTLRNPALARDVAQLLVNEAESYNRLTRQSQARVEREFTERRLQEATAELRAAEDRLESFLEHNRQFRTPLLRFEETRLNRAISDKQQLLTSVTQAYEQSRIEELRDNPVVTIIEQPIEPPLPNGRGTIVMVFLAGVGGLILGALVVLTRAWLSDQRAFRADGVMTTPLPPLERGLAALRRVTAPR